VLPIPLFRCDDQEFNGTIKQENIDNKVFTGIIKEEIIEEMDHNDDIRSFQIGYELNLHHSTYNITFCIQF